MSKLLKLAASAALLGGVLLTAPATATAYTPKYDWYVSQYAKVYIYGGGVGCATADFDTVQEALDAAGDGDSIYICRGTYIDSGMIAYGDITLVGAGRDKTILDGGYGGGCDGNGTATLTTTGYDITVRDLEFNNGCSDDTNGHDGGAIWAWGGTVNCFNSDFADNTAADEGGAIFASYVYLNKCDFAYNFASANDSGGGGGAVFALDVYANNSQFFNNTSDDWGGAFYSYDYFNVQKSYFSMNYAYYGGAIFGFNDAGNVSSSTFSSNDAGCRGGAIYTDSSGTDVLVVSNSTFNNNSASHDGVCYADGGAIFSTDDMSVLRSKFINNYAWGEGSAIYLSDYWDPNLVMNSNQFTGNGDNYATVYTCTDGYTSYIRNKFWNNADSYNIDCD